MRMADSGTEESPMLAAKPPTVADWNSSYPEDALHDSRLTQRSLLVAAPIIPERMEDLNRLLHSMANPPEPQHLETNRYLPFKWMKTVHFARLFILPPDDRPLSPAQLIFATDFDGSLADHLTDILAVAAPGLDEVFGHCTGWLNLADLDRAGQFTKLADFVTRHAVEANTFYTGTMKRGVAQIRREADLRAFIEDLLDQHVVGGTADKAAEIHWRIRAIVFKEPRFAWLHERPGPLPQPAPSVIANHVDVAFGGLLVLAHLAAIPVLALLIPWATAAKIAVIVLGLIVLTLVVGYVYLSYLNKRDPVRIRRNDENARVLVEVEDRIVQNQLTGINVIKKPVWFRRLVLQVVLAVANFACKVTETQGSLSGIPSIHFARWVILDGGRRLLFLSNFDGSWESYLGDFVDKAHKGLTAIWSNTTGFPRTKGLYGMGALDEQRFKAYARASQIPTQFWYSAYTELTVPDINNNSRLRLGLYRELDEEGAGAWLRMASPREQTKPEPEPTIACPPIDKTDVQGFVAKSYAKLHHAAYLPVSFDDERSARRWLGELLPALTAASVASDTVQNEGSAVSVAFTREGLRVLGVDDKDAVNFSREFIEGLAGRPHRHRLLGDVDRSDPEHWEWGGLRKQPVAQQVHALVFLFANRDQTLTDLLDAQKALATGLAVTLHDVLSTSWLNEKEHFGFKDGIAQPPVAGLGGVGSESSIPTGEVLLGYPNAYNQMPLSPSVPDNAASRRHLPPIAADPSRQAMARDFGRNGTYVVFRQLEQDVQSFWANIDKRTNGDAGKRKELAAKMIGRWPNGASLVRFASGEPDESPNNPDQFSYESDLDGHKCPLGAHIRRTNPRDSLLPSRDESLKVSARHRLLRRGRTYGPPISSTFDPDDILRAKVNSPVRRGLYFVCFNTDISRQFEFVQNAWMNSAKFNCLYGDPDAVLGPHDTTKAASASRCFTVQRAPVRTRHLDLRQFVTTVGGCYLFMPSFSALRYLADDQRPSIPKVDERHEWVENDGVRLHVVHAGKGPAVVLLHGFPENSETWKHQIPALVGAGYSVIAPDLRGYNQSDRPTAPGAYHLKHLVADVAAIIRASGQAKAHIVGHDWGGIVAWTFAGVHPEMVDTLVVMNAPHRDIYRRELRPFSPQFLKAWYVFLFLVPELGERLLSAFDFKLVRRLFGRMPALPAFTSAEIETYVAALARPGALTAALRWYRDNTDDESARLSRSAKTTAPTLVVWGMRDSTLVPELLDGLERYAPLLRVHKIEAASHWVQNEAPAEVNQTLVEFLDGHRQSGVDARYAAHV